MIASVSIFVKFCLTISADTKRDFYSDVYTILNGITITFGNFDMKSCILASLAALMTSSIWTSLELSPYAIFSVILVSNNTGSWETMPIWDRSHWSFSCRMSVPSATLMNGWNKYMCQLLLQLITAYIYQVPWNVYYLQAMTVLHFFYFILYFHVFLSISFLSCPIWDLWMFFCWDHWHSVIPPIHDSLPNLISYRIWLISWIWHHHFMSLSLFWLHTEFDMTEYRFPLGICNGYGMLTGDAYSSGHLVPSLWD